MNVLSGVFVIAIGLAPAPAGELAAGLQTIAMPDRGTASWVELASGPPVGRAFAPDVVHPFTAGPRFYAKDTHLYTSVWFAGRHRKMVPFGCTTAPYYDPHPRCADGRGFHHGIDIAMPCGTPLTAGVSGVVVDPRGPGELGPAYGPHAFRIRNESLGVDIIIGHTRKVFVDPGDRVTKHESIALASDAGAPDGCHLHFEVRPIAGSYTSAIDPLPLLQLERADGTAS
jgi:murein DD-endopeptidase MepM/ murein hydrolase activator NlpD